MVERDTFTIRIFGAFEAALNGVPLASAIRQTSAGVRGVNPDYGIMRSEIPLTGRFINAEDIEKRRRAGACRPQ